MSKRIYITGIAGFIGSQVAHALAARGDEVSGCDNFNPYYTPALKRARSDQLTQAGIDHTEADLSLPSTLEEAFTTFQPTHILHLAAQPGVRASITHPNQVLQQNIHNFLLLLECLRAHPHVHLIYASSSSVYGLGGEGPSSLESPTDQPRSLYAATKKANELMAAAYTHSFGLITRGLRFFTVYGPWGRPDMAVYRFAEAILDRKPLPLFDREMRRDFTYIDDLVPGVVAAIDREESNQVWNLGNGHPCSVGELILALEERLGLPAQLHLLPPPPGEAQITWADLTHSQDKLGYAPQISLKEGVTGFCDWLIDYRASSRTKSLGSSAIKSEAIRE